MFDLTVREVDGVPRMRDIDIAVTLGFSRPSNIRNLIKRNLKALAMMGEVACFATKHARL